MYKSQITLGDTPKLSPKFVGPYRIIDHLHGHKFVILDISSGDVHEVHGDHLKRLHSQPDADETDLREESQPVRAPSEPPSARVQHPSPSLPNTNPRYNLRSRNV